MIKKLRRKFVLILMCIVTLILLAVFITILLSTQSNNKRNSVNMLQTALRKPPGEPAAPQSGGKPLPPRENHPGTRLPVLSVIVDAVGTISIQTNQLFFINNEDIEPIVWLALKSNETTGVLGSYGLRYLKDDTDSGTHIAFSDISMERETIRILIINSLMVGGAALLLFFTVSLFLARWAVRPVEAAWERQKQFVADASHELKTPLTVILSNADMLRADDTDKDNKKIRRLEHIQAEAVRMRRLVEDMLVLAKSDSAERPPFFSGVDFSYLVTNAALMFEPIAYDEKKEFSYTVRENLVVLGEAQRLEQLIHILLDNALKYCPTDGVIHVELNEAVRHTALLKITNMGELIPKGELGQIFQRFYRLDKSRSHQGGFGLGLAIADSIVHEHGGRIWAESDEISGNCFTVSLPLK